MLQQLQWRTFNLTILNWIEKNLKSHIQLLLNKARSYNANAKLEQSFGNVREYHMSLYDYHNTMAKVHQAKATLSKLNKTK